jgi:hypothetical protein
MVTSQEYLRLLLLQDTWSTNSPCCKKHNLNNLTTHDNNICVPAWLSAACTWNRAITQGTLIKTLPTSIIQPLRSNLYVARAARFVNNPSTEIFWYIVMHLTLEIICVQKYKRPRCYSRHRIEIYTHSYAHSNANTTNLSQGTHILIHICAGLR